MVYNKKVLDAFYHPKNVGEIRNASGVGKVGNARCGDIMKMFLKIDDNGIITDAKFQTFGCTAAIASTSIATSMIIGKTVDEALKFKNSDVLKQLGELPASKIHCSVLAEEAIQAAIENWKRKKDKKTSIESVVTKKITTTCSPAQTFEKKTIKPKFDKAEIFSEIDEKLKKISKAAKKIK